MLLQVNLSIFTIGKTPTFHFLSTPSADRSRSARPAGSGQTRRGEGGAYGVQGGGGEYGSEAGVGAAPVDPTGPPAERIGGGGGGGEQQVKHGSSCQRRARRGMCVEVQCRSSLPRTHLGGVASTWAVRPSATLAHWLVSAVRWKRICYRAGWRWWGRGSVEWRGLSGCRGG